MRYLLFVLLLGACAHNPSDSSDSYSVSDGMRLIEGDIALESDSNPRPAIKYPDSYFKYYSWPKGVVPYVIDTGLVDQKRILDAIAYYHLHTKVRFVPRTTQADYVNFVMGDGCWSWIGRVRGAQKLTLAPAPNCTMGTVIHELGHVLGLWHEHMRSDRDKYVTIYLENVISGQEYNFKPNPAQTQSFYAYDFDSIMHYPWYTFSKNGQATITKKDGSTTGFGQQDHLSASDIKAIHYINGL